jgi:hypothetical protein
LPLNGKPSLAVVSGAGLRKPDAPSSISSEEKERIVETIEGFIDTLDAEHESITQYEATMETQARARASEAAAILGDRYAGFDVITPKESKLLRWAKMQMEIRHLQYECRGIVEELTDLAEPDPAPTKILRAPSLGGSSSGVQ